VWYSVVRTEGSMLECTVSCSTSDVRGLGSGRGWRRLGVSLLPVNADVSQGIYMRYWARWGARVVPIG
jgi:hypothetical protein